MICLVVVLQELKAWAAAFFLACLYSACIVQYKETGQKAWVYTPLGLLASCLILDARLNNVSENSDED